MAESSKRRREIDRLFDEALELAGPEREAFVRSRAGDDRGLGEAVLHLIECAQKSGEFLSPAGVMLGPAGRAIIEDMAGESAAPPQAIDPYRIVRELGRGGMSVVYLAERSDGAFEQQVALKLMRPGSDTPELSRRFEQERQILASLNHPAIARLYDGGSTADGQPYFAMEVVYGEPIDVYCDRLRLPIDRRLRLFIQVAHAVQHAHQKLIVHRDLKPSNILVSADGDLKLLDFGIAKLLDPTVLPHSAPATRTALRPMTPEYASPEQIHGTAPGVASDIYQLGLLLYQLLTGRMPYSFDPHSTPSIARAICEEEPLRPSLAVTRPRGVGHDAAAAARATTVGRLKRMLQGDLDNIVLMALRKEPERRYASADQLAEDVSRFRGHRPLLARPDTARYRFAKFVRRNRVAVSAAALIFITVAGFWFRLLDERNRARTEALKATQVADFMVELFEAADPKQIVREQLTARELLDQGVARIATDLAGQEEVQTHLMQTIGRVYTSLGLYEDAEQLLVPALKQRLAAFGPDHLEVARIRQQLGALYYHSGDYAAAEPLLEQAFATKEELLGAEDPELVDLLERLFMLHGRLNDPENAEQLFERCLRLAEQTRGPDDVSVATILNNFALLIRAHDPHRAQSLIERSVEILEKTLAPDHPFMLAGLTNLAELRRKNGQTDGLEALHQRLQATLEDKLPGTLELASVYIEYGLFLENVHRDDEAREPYQKAIAIYQSNGHPNIAYPLGFLADLHAKAGEFDQARELHAEAIRVREMHYGPDHPLVGVSMELLANLHIRAGDLVAAEETIERALAILEESVAPNDSKIARTWITQGDLWAAMGQHADAEKSYRAAIAAYAEGRPDDYPALARARGLLGESLVRSRRFAEAETLLLRSYEVLREDRDASERLVRLYEAWDQPAKAEQYRVALD